MLTIKGLENTFKILCSTVDFLVYLVYLCSMMQRHRIFFHLKILTYGNG